jgi:hypothetical protein
LAKEYDLHTVSGKARLAALLLVLLTLIAFLIGALELSYALGAGTVGGAANDILFGLLWIIAGVVGLLISNRIRDGDSLMWVVGLLIGIVVMVRTYDGILRVNLNRQTIHFDLLDAVAFLLALIMTILLLLALLERDRDRARR